MRLSVTLACLLVAGAAAAESARVRWRGVAVEGRAPASLQPAVAAHVGVALKQLGSSLVTAGAFDVEAAASCAFPASAKVAHCRVVVARARGAKAERRAEIRYRDAEDLAESMALLVSDILTADFADIVGGARAVNPPAAGPSPLGPSPVSPSPVGPPPSPGPSPSNRAANPPPVATSNPAPAPPTTAAPTPPTPPPSVTPTPTPLPTPEQQKAHEAEMQRQLDVVRSLQKQADEARAARERERPTTTTPPAPRLPPATRTAVELGVVGLFGLGPANPTLVGGTARSVWTRGLLRAGASLSLDGMRQRLDGHDLSFLRLLLAARVGVGTHGALVDFDVTGGPALFVLVDDAHSEGRHAVASFAVAVGPRLALTLAGPLALVAGADLDVAVTDEKIVAGDTRVAQFSRASIELTLGIAWRSGR